MGYVQAVLLILALFIGAGPVSWRAHAGQWSAVAGTAGFQGTISLGAAYNPSVRHQWQLMFGQYTINNGHGLQINTGYFYSPFKIEREQFSWFPLNAGLIALYAMDHDDYFTESPSKYPTPNYYEQTGIRLGLVMGSSIAMNHDQLHLVYELILLDAGVVALWNNRTKDASYFWSSGLKMRYVF